jgi:hypothetical protein
MPRRTPQQRGVPQMRRVLLLLLACSSFSFLSYRLAAQQTAVPQTQSPNISAPRNSEGITAQTPEMTACRCYTNQQGCSGYATFGVFPTSKNCTIWVRKGAGGRQDFFLGANSSQDRYVNYTDVDACTDYPSVPDGSQTWYICVHP